MVELLFGSLVPVVKFVKVLYLLMVHSDPIYFYLDLFLLGVGMQDAYATTSEAQSRERGRSQEEGYPPRYSFSDNRPEVSQRFSCGFGLSVIVSEC